MVLDRIQSIFEHHGSTRLANQFDAIYGLPNPYKVRNVSIPAFFPMTRKMVIRLLLQRIFEVIVASMNSSYHLSFQVSLLNS